MQARILIVDDEPDIRSVLAKRLQKQGYEVLEAADGELAIAAVRREAIDIVLLDVNMPGLNGFEVLERFQHEPDPPAVIFVSAMNQLDNRLRGLYGGAVDYVTKPFDYEELLARVAAAVRERTKLEGARADSMTDALTGLGNRRTFEEILRTEVERAKRYEHALALIYLDADGLKEVNDQHGHAGGDAYLKAIARAIRATCRTTDKPARIGGDEYAVVMPETDSGGAAQFLERLPRTMAQEDAAIEGVTIRPSVSTGLALYPSDADDEKGLMAVADAALYASKRARGRLR